MDTAKMNYSLRNSPPIIVIGMHRSGTSIVAELMSSLGVHMGNFRDVNHEPRTHISMNNWILRQAGTTWEYPLAIKRLSRSFDAENAVVDTVTSASNRTAFRLTHMHTGKKRYIRWGWKDPRNTITLPIWLKVYPEAQIIYVHRHGVQVAASLNRRNLAIKEYAPMMLHRLLTPLTPGYSLGSRAWTLQDSLEMWGDYCTLAESHLCEVPNKVLTIAYEHLLENPDNVVRQLSTFIGDARDEALLSAVVSKVKPGNPYSFRKDSELLELERKNRALLSIHNY